MIKLNFIKNEVDVDGYVITFSKRWEAVFLFLLLGQARSNQALQAENLNNELIRRGQSKPLTRVQQQRLVESLSNGLAAIPNKPLIITHAPRKLSVGPWQLKSTISLDCQVTQDAPVVPKEDSVSATVSPRQEMRMWPKFLCTQDDAVLLRLLRTLLISDSFAVVGNFIDATDMLQPVFDFNLTQDAFAMITLADAGYHRRLGSFSDARRLAQQVLSMDPVGFHDNALRQYAHFLLDRIDYDDEPGISHSRLWAIASCPDSMQCIDMSTYPEWHNLRALLIRRRILDIVERKASSSEGESIDALHQQALLHFEIAIYCAWQHQKWERLQAYVANLAFHMQEMIPLGLCNVLQVFSWYELTMLYEDRLNAGQDSAWTFIFLAEFWLDHEAALRAELRKRADGEDSLTIIENLHPAKQEFYLRAIERLRYCGDARQVAIAWICYGRFAQKTMGDAVVQQTVKNKLVELFRENPKVKVGLMKERYEGHLARLM